MNAIEVEEVKKLIKTMINQLDACFIIACRKRDFKEMARILKDTEKLNKELEKISK